MNTKLKYTLISSIFASGMIFQASLAQEFTNKAAPEGARVFGNWAKTCEKDPNDASVEACFVSQSMILKENNAEVLYIAVGKIPNVPEPVLAVTTPLRTFLPSGIKIQIDSAEAQTLPHEFCDKFGCHLRVGVKQEVVESLKKGNNVNIEFRDAIGQKLNIPVSLSGFTKAYNSL